MINIILIKMLFIIVLFVGLVVADNYYASIGLDSNKTIIDNSFCKCVNFTECYNCYNKLSKLENIYIISYVPSTFRHCLLFDETFMDNDTYYPVALNIHREEIPDTLSQIQSFFSVSINYLCYQYINRQDMRQLSFYIF